MLFSSFRCTEYDDEISEVGTRALIRRSLTGFKIASARGLRCHRLIHGGDCWCLVPGLCSERPTTVALDAGQST